MEGEEEESRDRSKSRMADVGSHIQTLPLLLHSVSPFTQTLSGQYANDDLTNTLQSCPVRTVQKHCD